MKLTQEQQAILDGARGETMAKVMETLVAYGDTFRAERMVPITGQYGHTVISFGLGIMKPVYDLYNELIEAGLTGGQRFTADPRPMDDKVPASPLEKLVVKKFMYSQQDRLEEQMHKLGLTSDDENNEATSDNRTIENRAKNGDKRAMLVESMFCHQLTKYIGGFAAAMGGVDAVVFTGGIGENNPQYRTRIAENIKFLGTDIDEEKNHIRGEEVEISVPGSKVRMFVIPTNEELVIARDTLEIVNSL